MNQQLFNALSKVGWQTIVLKAPAVAASLGSKILSANDGGKRAKVKADLEAMKKAREGLKGFVDGINQMSEDAYRNVNFGVPNEYLNKDGKGDAIGMVFSELKAVAPSLFQELESAQEFMSKRKTKKNVPAYRIAETLAEIYVLGTGQMPTIGTDPITGHATGKFGKVCFEVFGIIDVKISPQSLEPCRTAIIEIGDARKERLFDLRERILAGVEQKKRISLFSEVDALFLTRGIQVSKEE